MSKAKEEYESIIRPYNEIVAVMVCDAYITELELEKAELISKLEFIKEFGYKNSGCGFSCAKIADEVLNKFNEVKYENRHG